MIKSASPRKKKADPKRPASSVPKGDVDIEDAVNWHREFLASMSDRDLGFLLISNSDIDWDAQLLAIRSFLGFRKMDDDAFEREFDEIKTAAKSWRGPSMQIDMEYVDHLHGKVFKDAAHSMAAVGMLAPFIESLFEQIFYGIRDKFEREGRRLSSPRRRKLKASIRWDCHYITNKGVNIVAGILDLAAATGTAGFLPSDLKRTLEALFGYRNKNFHRGMEWPVSERRAFARRTQVESWPTDWFEHSSHDREPWIFYMSDKFVHHCLDLIEGTLSGMGAYYRSIETG